MIFGKVKREICKDSKPLQWRKIASRSAKTCQTSNFGVMQLLVILIEFCPMSPFYASPVFDRKRGHNYTAPLKTHQFLLSV